MLTIVETPTFAQQADAYWEDAANGRVVLRFTPRLAPYKAAVFPLLKNKPELVEKAHQVFQGVSRKFAATWDERGNIGKRYYAQDEIGTPFCITIDFQTLEDETVTVRERDSMAQVRVAIGELNRLLAEKIEGGGNLSG